MLRLTFRPMEGGPIVVSRAAYFRLCADATLRGPDNCIAATCLEGRWHVGSRMFERFDCTGPISLRMSNENAARPQHFGPFSLVSAVGARLYADDTDLLIRLPESPRRRNETWREITLLTAQSAFAHGGPAVRNASAVDEPAADRARALASSM